ncbi:MAG TPA: tetratricopeptide repeat protein [Thermodesulfobacteriota bacterium]|nr:tetratricopeptide repeat protein [Thermodesulfobacteriota bacterium]
MTSTKKIIKRKLKEPDEFITLSERIYLFVTHHAKPIALGVGFVLVLLLLIFLFQTWERKNSESANQMFNAAVEIYQMVSSPYREGAPEEYKNVIERFNEVMTKFPKTQAGKLAILYKGNLHLRLGEFDEAIKAYDDYLKKAGKEKLYRAFAMEGLGYSYEGKRDYEKAMHAFQKVIDLGESFQLANAYLDLGRCNEKMGKTKEALENYRSFMKRSQKSQMANIVLRKMSTLEK